MDTIMKKGAFGGVTGASSQIGKNIIKPSGVIGKPVKAPIKTYENEFNGVAGFGTAVTKNIIENNDK